MENLQIHAGTVLESDHRTIDEGFDKFITLATAGTIDAATVAPAIEGLRRHIWVEEETFFPPLRQAGVVGPVMVMLREHGELWAHLDELEELLSKPEPDQAFILEASARITRALAQHNFKEENILYASAARFLDDESIHQIVAENLTAERPRDWVCAMAPR